MQQREKVSICDAGWESFQRVYMLKGRSNREGKLSKHAGGLIETTKSGRGNPEIEAVVLEVIN